VDNQANALPLYTVSPIEAALILLGVIKFVLQSLAVRGLDTEL
jgi:hypothetical protein